METNCVSKPEWSRLEFLWRVEDFWELRALASIEALDEEGGDVLWSAPFGDTERGIWRLKVYPYGDASPAGRGHVSVFLAFDYQASSRNRIYAIFSCAALDAAGAKIQGQSFTRQRFAEGSASWGWSQFVKNENDALQSLLTDGHALTLRVTIDLFLGVKVSNRQKIEGCSLADDMKKFVAMNGTQDVFLNVRGERISGNRAVLSARSKVLRKLLYKDSWEKAEDDENFDLPEGIKWNSSINEVDIKHEDLPYPAVNQLVTFCATDTCDALQKSAAPLADLLELLMAACILNVPSLKNQCSSQLSERICSRADAALILVVAEKYGCDALAGQARRFLQFCTPELAGHELLQILVTSKPQQNNSTPKA